MAPNITQPSVSIIIPTKNSGEFIEACLRSVKNQSYSNIEIIVVDNFSTDNTAKIARKYVDRFYQLGPERSTQRNFGVKHAHGKYVAIIDSDMELSENVIKDCVEAMKDSKAFGVIIPEESFGEGFWAKCKKLERSFYIGIDWIEAARFFTKKMYLEIGGYNENLVSGEDWDLSNRVKLRGDLIRIKSLIYHNEGRILLRNTLRKKAYYAGHISKYVTTNTSNTSMLNEVLKVFMRYKLYLSHPIKLLKNPFVGFGMLYMKTLEFCWGLLGFIASLKLKILNNSKMATK